MCKSFQKLCTILGSLVTTSDWNLMESRVASCIRFSEYVEFMSATTLEIAMTEFMPNSIQTIFSSLFLNVFAQLICLMRKICHGYLYILCKLTCKLGFTKAK